MPPEFVLVLGLSQAKEPFEIIFSSMKYSASAVLVGLALFNAGLALWSSARLSVKSWRSQAGWKSSSESYSYIGDDFPFFHPTLPMRYTTLTYQESIRFGYNATDRLESGIWRSLTNQPTGFGRAHLGVQRRSFLFTFYHQFHCLSQFHRALQNRTDEIATLEHVDHCLQYLRQTLLCSATDTLEKGDFMKRNFETDRVGPESTCVNWELIFGEIDRSWNDFAQWRELWN